MDLGNFSVSLAVKDIEASRTFYEKLGFKIFCGDATKGWLILKNGNHVVGLFQGMFDRNILTFNPGWDSNAQKLPRFTDVRELQRATGTVGTPVRVETVSDTTTQANAFSIGFGPSRRVVLWDTILRFPEREVRVVMAHELGHVARRHVLKGVLWFALFVLPLLALLAKLMQRRGGLADPARFPLALLVASLLALAVTPAENLVSRRYEANTCSTTANGGRR